MADILTELFSNNINSEEYKVIKQYEYNLFSNFREISRSPFGIVRTAKWDDSIIILKSITIDTNTMDREFVNEIMNALNTKNMDIPDETTMKRIIAKLKNMRFSLIDDQKSPFGKWVEIRVLPVKSIGQDLKVIETNDHTIKEIENELKHIISIESHENIIKFHGIAYEIDKWDSSVVEYVLILEYADNGTLREYLHQNSTKIEWALKVQFAIQLVAAVKWLHIHNIVHGDLHPNNILIHRDIRGEILKLADFGLSRRVINASMSQTTGEVFGIIPYIDPQCFIEEISQDGKPLKYKKNKKSDIYSIGVILWEISSEKQPFKNENPPKLPFNIINGLREKPIADTNLEYVAIYQRCWQGKREDRPSIEEVATAFEDLIVQDISVNDSCVDIYDISKSEFEKYIDTAFKGIATDFSPDVTIVEQYDMTLFINNLYSTFSKLFNEGKPARDIIINFISKSNKTKEEIFQWLLTNNNNHPKYICLLGLFYHWKIGTDENNVVIVELFVNAAEKEDIIAQYFSGKCYAEGWNTDKNKKKALEWYNKAAENECASAEYVLGEYFYKLRKYAKAFEFLERAANHGNLKALNTLGVCYQKGQGTDSSVVEGLFNILLEMELNPAVE
ncbi:10804_t:CDS:2 [Gigaspora margarita]|uniref:10804_t:CDS:1 n=1 Tax=Gigaspora margarita TaxID=4874 RepID=A0ABN7VBK0_GIGMA|nr:10804_t:CDS:2 [Gigaspora margarita]